MFYLFICMFLKYVITYTHYLLITISKIYFILPLIANILQRLSPIILLGANLSAVALSIILPVVWQICLNFHSVTCRQGPGGTCTNCVSSMRLDTRTWLTGGYLTGGYLTGGYRRVHLDYTTQSAGCLTAIYVGQDNPIGWVCLPATHKITVVSQN